MWNIFQILKLRAVWTDKVINCCYRQTSWLQNKYKGGSQKWGTRCTLPSKAGLNHFTMQNIWEKKKTVIIIFKDGYIIRSRRNDANFLHSSVDIQNYINYRLIIRELVTYISLCYSVSENAFLTGSSSMAEVLSSQEVHTASLLPTFIYEICLSFLIQPICGYAPSSLLSSILFDFISIIKRIFLPFHCSFKLVPIITNLPLYFLLGTYNTHSNYLRLVASVYVCAWKIMRQRIQQ